MVKPKVVAAAGCVVVRRDLDVLKVLVIHRPHYDDWSFPKGKRDEGETDLECALRELEEETGVRAEPFAELNAVSYKIPSGKDKRVRFWAANYVEGEFVVNQEVDEIRWLTVPEASELLSYDIDRQLLDECFALIN